MRQKTVKIIGLSIIGGVLSWIIDTGVDIVFFHEGPFLKQLISEVPPHQIFMRSIIFAFDFEDGSGGQSEVDLTIRNNVPEIKDIDDEKVYERKTIEIDLSDYEYDVEDSDEDLRWEVESDNDKVKLTLDGKELQIKGLDKGTSTVTVRLYDLDNEYDEETFEAFHALSPRPHWSDPIALDVAIEERAAEIIELLGKSNTHIYVAGYEKVKGMLDKAFSNILGSKEKWETRKAELIAGKKWAEIIY